MPVDMNASMARVTKEAIAHASRMNDAGVDLCRGWLPHGDGGGVFVVVATGRAAADVRGLVQAYKDDPSAASFALAAQATGPGA